MDAPMAIEEIISKVVIDIVESKEQPHPILNNEVLQALFEYVPLKDLKACRQVSKLFFESSLSRWRRDVWVQLKEKEGESGNGDLSIVKYMDFIDKSPSEKNDDLYQFGKHPYSKFKLYNWDLKSLGDGEGKSERQVGFWKRCGPQLTHLEIGYSNFNSRQEFDSILFGFLPHLEFLYLNANTYNFQDDVLGGEKVGTSTMDECLQTTPLKSMKALHLSLQGGLSSGTNLLGDEITPDAKCPVNWLQFFGRYPNLKSLKLTDIDGNFFNARREFEDILAAMLNLAQDHGVEWKIGKLDILLRNSMNLTIFEKSASNLLRQLKFPLTELSLDIGAVTRYEVFKGILETYALTLRKLLVYRHTIKGVGVGYEEPFPFGVQLNVLTELCLTGTAAFVTLNFLPFTPNLRRLAFVQDVGNSLLAASPFLFVEGVLEDLIVGQIDDRRILERPQNIISGSDFKSLEGFACSQLEEFIYSARDASICFPRDVASIASLMPNLKMLMLGMGNDGFRVACQAWKELEVLIVQPNDVDECGLTGFLPMLPTRLPNINDLSRLRYFGMGYETPGLAQACLSDDSVLKGILSLGSLQDITVVCSDGMSNKVFHQLRSKFPHAKINKEMEKVQGIFEWPFVPECRHASYSEDDDFGGDWNLSIDDEDDV